MKYKAIIFDLDGTLLDTLEDLGNAVNRVLSTNGFPTHEIDAYRYFVGDGVATLITKALPIENRNDETIRDCSAGLRKDYAINWNVRTKPYDGIVETLKSLKTRGLKISILSNKPHKYTKLCVDGFFPNIAFDLVLGQKDTVPQKPDPAGALQIAGELDIPPSDFIYLGDTAVDMKTATTAGMFPVGVLWGFRQAEELLGSGAKILINHPMEIMDLLDKTFCS